MAFRFNEQALSMLDSPWLRRQVDTHIIFGPLSRKFPFGWIVLFIFSLNFLSTFLSDFSALTIAEGAQKKIFVLVSLMILKMSQYRQAAFGWCITKFLGGLVAFIILIAGGLVGFFRNQPDATHVTLLAIIWFPWLEFIPKFTVKQKFITVGRIAMSIPIAYLGYQTGNWFWR